MKSYFIVGTDTNCGKTYTTCQIVRFLKDQQKQVLALKPIASGCVEQNGELINEDVISLQQANENTSFNISPWRYREPVSPHIAASIEGEQISTQEIVDFCTNKQFSNLDYLLIEGAGGLMVPLNEQDTWIDFLLKSQISVILVVGMRLGCLNHALLTAHALKNYGITCVGWIANMIDPAMLFYESNLKTLEQRLEWPLLAKISYGGHYEEKNFNS